MDEYIIFGRAYWEWLIHHYEELGRPTNVLTSTCNGAHVEINHGIPIDTSDRYGEGYHNSI